MRKIVELARLTVVLPIMALEAVIKSLMYIIYFPMCFGIGLVYPWVKKNKDLSWVDGWYTYATTWVGGFILSSRVWEKWE